VCDLETSRIGAPYIYIYIYIYNISNLRVKYAVLDITDLIRLNFQSQQSHNSPVCVSTATTGREGLRVLHRHAIHPVSSQRQTGEYGDKWRSVCNTVTHRTKHLLNYRIEHPPMLFYFIEGTLFSDISIVTGERVTDIYRRWNIYVNCDRKYK